MGWFKQHKLTALTILVLALGFIFGVGSVVDPDASAGDRTWGVGLLVGGAVSVVGLWCLATKRLTPSTNQVLIAIGLIATGAFAIQTMVDDFAFFVWVFGPLLVLALIALWLGVANRGVQRELAG